VFRPISGLPHIHSLCLKHTDEGISCSQSVFRTYVLNTDCEHEDDLNRSNIINNITINIDKNIVNNINRIQLCLDLFQLDFC
jgi:hypothetical protein